MNDVKLYDTPQAAAILKVSTKTTGRYAKEGIIKAAKIGGHWQFTEDALARFIRGDAPERRTSPPTTGDALALFVPGLAAELRELRVLLYRGGPIKASREKLDAILAAYIAPMENITTGT